MHCTDNINTEFSGMSSSVFTSVLFHFLYIMLSLAGKYPVDFQQQVSRLEKITGDNAP